MATRKISVEMKVLLTVEVEVYDLLNDEEALDAVQEEVEGLLIQTDFDAKVVEVKQVRRKSPPCSETAHFRCRG